MSGLPYLESLEAEQEDDLESLEAEQEDEFVLVSGDGETREVNFGAAVSDVEEAHAGCEQEPHWRSFQSVLAEFNDRLLVLSLPKTSAAQVAGEDHDAKWDEVLGAKNWVAVSDLLDQGVLPRLPRDLVNIVRHLALENHEAQGQLVLSLLLRLINLSLDQSPLVFSKTARAIKLLSNTQFPWQEQLRDHFLKGVVENFVLNFVTVHERYNSISTVNAFIDLVVALQLFGRAVLEITDQDIVAQMIGLAGAGRFESAFFLIMLLCPYLQAKDFTVECLVSAFSFVRGSQYKGEGVPCVSSYLFVERAIALGVNFNVGERIYRELISAACSGGDVEAPYMLSAIALSVLRRIAEVDPSALDATVGKYLCYIMMVGDILKVGVLQGIVGVLSIQKSCTGLDPVMIGNFELILKSLSFIDLLQQKQRTIVEQKLFQEIDYASDCPFWPFLWRRGVDSDVDFLGEQSPFWTDLAVIKGSGDGLVSMFRPFESRNLLVDDVAFMGFIRAQRTQFEILIGGQELDFSSEEKVTRFAKEVESIVIRYQRNPETPKIIQLLQALIPQLRALIGSASKASAVGGSLPFANAHGGAGAAAPAKEERQQGSCCVVC